MVVNIPFNYPLQHLFRWLFWFSSQSYVVVWCGTRNIIFIWIMLFKHSHLLCSNIYQKNIIKDFSILNALGLESENIERNYDRCCRRKLSRLLSLQWGNEILFLTSWLGRIYINSIFMMKCCFRGKLVTPGQQLSTAQNCRAFLL